MLMFVLFALSAYVQWNDPDPLLWIVLYAVAALFSALAVWRPWKAHFAWAWGGVAAVWFATLLPALTRVNWDRWVDDEVAREAGGLLIVALWMCVLGVWGRRHKQSDMRATNPSKGAQMRD